MFYLVIRQHIRNKFSRINLNTLQDVLLSKWNWSYYPFLTCRHSYPTHTYNKKTFKKAIDNNYKISFKSTQHTHTHKRTNLRAYFYLYNFRPNLTTRLISFSFRTLFCSLVYLFVVKFADNSQHIGFSCYWKDVWVCRKLLFFFFVKEIWRFLCFFFLLHQKNEENIFVKKKNKEENKNGPKFTGKTIENQQSRTPNQFNMCFVRNLI